MKLNLLLAATSLVMLVTSHSSYAVTPDFLTRGFYHCDDHPTKSCTKRDDICKNIQEFDKCAEKCIIKRRVDEKTDRIEAKLKSCDADFISRSKYVSGKETNQKIVDILNATKRRSAPARLETTPSEQQAPRRPSMMMGQRPPSGVHEPVMPESTEVTPTVPSRRHSMMMGQRPPSGVHEPVMPEETVPMPMPETVAPSMPVEEPMVRHEPPTPPLPMPPKPPLKSLTPPSGRLTTPSSPTERKQQPPSLMEQIREGTKLSPATERKLKEKPTTDEGLSMEESLRRALEGRRPAIEGDDEPEEETEGWDD